MVKIKYICILVGLFISMEGFSYWRCTLECQTRSDREVGRILRHASGTDYSDFNAECKQAKGRSTYPGSSDCDYVYCLVYEITTEKVYGSGSTLTEARKAARESCNPVNTITCGKHEYRTIGQYDCSE